MTLRTSREMTRSSWDRLYIALWQRREATSGELRLSDVASCLSATPGLAFGAGVPLREVLAEMSDLGAITIHGDRIVVHQLSEPQDSAGACARRSALGSPVRRT